MSDINDTELLHQFAQTGQQEAFAELVRRYVDVVYAAARRQAAGDAELAEDITQRVFILLSQKAATISQYVILGGWLFNTTRFVALNEMRDAKRRTIQEQKAAAMAEEIRKSQSPAKPPAWDDAEGVLDDAMGKLDQQTRGVLVMKFFEGKTAREVGDRLGISEEAARKRTSRAIEQLRTFFARRGVNLTDAQIAQGLSIPLIKAPAHVATSATLAATSSAISTATTSAPILKGAISIMAAIKTQTAIVTIIGLIALGGAVVGGAKLIHAFSSSDEEVVQAVPVADGPKMSGIVRGTDGKAVVGAKVLVAAEKSPVYLPVHGREPTAALTDANGRYTVVKPNPPYAIFVMNDFGYAQASWRSLASGTDLTLQPWGKVEGIVKIGDNVVPHASVTLWRIPHNKDPWEPLMHLEENTRADANGHFLFTRIPPGEVWLTYRADRGLAQSSSTSLRWKYVQVEAGQTADVQIGGSGTRVVGHIDVPPALLPIVSFTNQPPHSTMGSYNRTDVPRPHPNHDPNETPEQFTTSQLKFGQTPEGIASNDWMITSNFAINPDGTFAIDDLPPGKYSIMIRCFEEQPAENFNEDVARGEAEVFVPPALGPSTEPVSTPPIDLGAVTLKAIEHHARPGQPAPDFTVTTIDGKTWKLSDQKGKTVVLYFWATYRQNMGEDKFGAVADRLSANPNVVILGLCMTNDDAKDKNATVRSVADKMNFHFPQSTDGQRMLDVYDSSWPEAILINSDGVVVLKYLDADHLEKALAQQSIK